MVNSGVKIEWVDHMDQRVSAHRLPRKPQVARVAVDDMPPLSRSPPHTPLRKPSLESTDPFGFTKIGKE